MECHAVPRSLEGKRASTVAAASVVLAAKMFGAQIEPRDVAVCAQLSTETVTHTVGLIEGHWNAMFNVDVDAAFIEGLKEKFNERRKI